MIADRHYGEVVDRKISSLATQWIMTFLINCSEVGGKIEIGKNSDLLIVIPLSFLVSGGDLVDFRR